MNDTLFSLQGYIKVALRLSNGRPGPLHWLGNVPEATLALNQESVDKNESFSGERSQIGRLNTGRTCVFSGTLDYWSAKNMALGLYAEPSVITASSVTGELLPPGLLAGDVVQLNHAFASALVLTDSTPVTPLVVDTDDFRLIGHGDNQVEIITPGAYVQPFKAAYSKAAVDNLAIFATLPPERYIVFDGINTETGEPILIDLYKGRFDPFGSIALINQEYGNLPFQASILRDSVAAIDPTLGGFGRIRTRQPT